MKIYYRKKLMSEIKDVIGLEKFIIEKKLYKFFRKFQIKEHPSIQDKLNETDKITYKQIKPWLKDVLNYPETIYNKKFLECMGWDDVEIEKFISENQKNNSQILSRMKKETPELFYNKTTSRVEYWLNKGFSPQESKNKVSERQRTFSKKICIEKYGEKKGLEVFNERQIKWVNSLINNPFYSEINKNKNAYKYDSKNILDLIQNAFFSENIKKTITDNINVENINDFILNIINTIDIKRYSDIQPFIYSKLIQAKFNTDKETIRKIFYEKTSFDLDQQTYGKIVYHRGIRFKSYKEYEIAKFLEKKNVEYFYEKNYPNSNFKYDFYLPEKNVYVEYYGMLDNKNDEKLNSYQKKYKEKMIQKNSFCEKNNLYLIESTNYKTLINKLNEIL
jgi:hypothetical protein